jgi:hypothetical protein
MSEFFNSLLNPEGCTVDGSIGRNPFTGALDRMFDQMNMFNEEVDMSMMLNNHSDVQIYEDNVIREDHIQSNWPVNPQYSNDAHEIYYPDNASYQNSFPSSMIMPPFMGQFPYPMNNQVCYSAYPHIHGIESSINIASYNDKP